MIITVFCFNKDWWSFQNYLILSKAIDSIFQNIFTENFQILISYETNNVQIVNYIKGLKNSKIIKNKVDNFTWYNWMIKSSQYAKILIIYI